MENSLTFKKVLSIDLGLKRIGIATTYDGNLLSPQKAVLRKNRDQAAAEVKALIEEFEVCTVVVGIPMGGSSEAEMRRRVAHFMKLVAFTGEIYLEDESDSSLEAEALMKGKIRQKKDGKVDSIAAMIILERFLKSKKKERLKI